MNSRRLIGLLVVTESGQDLGKVGSIDIDTESGRLTTLRVKTRGLVQGLLDQELFADWSQVVSIDEDKVTVSDASVPGGAKAFATSRTAEQTASPSGTFLAQEEEG